MKGYKKSKNLEQFLEEVKTQTGIAIRSDHVVSMFNATPPHLRPRGWGILALRSSDPIFCFTDEEQALEEFITFFQQRVVKKEQKQRLSAQVNNVCTREIYHGLGRLDEIFPQAKLTSEIAQNVSNAVSHNLTQQHGRYPTENQDNQGGNYNMSADKLKSILDTSSIKEKEKIRRFYKVDEFNNTESSLLGLGNLSVNEMTSYIPTRKPFIWEQPWNAEKAAQIKALFESMSDKDPSAISSPIDSDTSSNPPPSPAILERFQKLEEKVAELDAKGPALQSEPSPKPDPLPQIP